jgi:hypothetical protein
VRSFSSFSLSFREGRERLTQREQDNPHRGVQDGGEAPLEGDREDGEGVARDFTGRGGSSFFFLAHSLYRSGTNAPHVSTVQSTVQLSSAAVQADIENLNVDNRSILDKLESLASGAFSYALPNMSLRAHFPLRHAEEAKGIDATVEMLWDVGVEGEEKQEGGAPMAT